MPKPPSPSQPQRPRRFWLFAPYAAVVVAFVAWSGVWLAERARVEGSLTDAKSQGLSWSQLTINGWPFRLHVTLAHPRFTDPSGWGLDAPIIEAVGLAYTPDHWVMGAPQGLTLIRPGKGPLIVTGQALRASAAALGSGRPRFAFEGDGLVFAPGPGGDPGPLASAAKLELDLQQGPDDQGLVFIGLDGAMLQPQAPLAALSGGKPMSLLWDARLTHVSTFKGAGWPAMLQAWTGAGGSMHVVQGKIGLSGVTFSGEGGPLTVGPDGRLAGSVPLKLDPGPVTGKPLLQGLGLLGPVTLSFKDGRAAIGLIPLGPALKVG